MLSENILYLFTGSWCTPCRMQKKILEEAGIPYTLIMIDTDEGTRMANDNYVHTIPTMIYNGKRLEGVNNAEQVKELTKKR